MLWRSCFFFSILLFIVTSLIPSRLTATRQRTLDALARDFFLNTKRGAELFTFTYKQNKNKNSNLFRLCFLLVSFRKCAAGGREPRSRPDLDIAVVTTQ
ncbi:hypothetical protein EDD21DRAFT_392118 [Dissophora ornata]|nr:hypothetical protein EDD21DRAFT_392118 [Dissophora ornata]